MPRSMKNGTDLEICVLAALQRRGKASSVRSLVSEGYLTHDVTNIGYGVALAGLERKGLVRSWYPSVESAGVAKIWEAVG